MNFFKHHLGDYDSATTHLSWDEDMAYSRLMRVYYRDEKPIPIEPRAAYRLARAQTKSQREAVNVVLAEFFMKQVDGWHNKRCDEEIAAAQAQAETNRRIATNRPRIVNGSYHDSYNGSLTNRPPIQTPDSNNQTPDSTHPPQPLPAREGRVRVERDSGWRPPPDPEIEFAQLANGAKHAGK